MTYFKVRNDISVATLTRILRAMCHYLQVNNYDSYIDVISSDVKDLRIYVRPGLPQEVWKEFLDLDIENMPRNGIVLIEEED